MKNKASRIRPLLLVLLWVWAGCMFLVLDLFKNIDEFDGIRPRAPLYVGMRRAAHKMIGEPLPQETPPAPQSAATRTVEQRRADGSLHIQREVRTRGGRQVNHGLFCEYYPDGARKLEGAYRHGKKTGTWNAWHKNGTRVQQETYEKGVRNGPVRHWSPKGALVAQTEFRNGIVDGWLTVWHPNGKKASEGLLRNGLHEGTWTFWDTDGNKLRQRVYRAGQ